jgi:hypothetical protein
MSEMQSAGSGQEKATRDDIRRVIGNIDDFAAAQILKLGPTVVDLEEAAIWSSGDGDVLAKNGRPLSATAAQILEIVEAKKDDRLPPEE